MEQFSTILNCEYCDELLNGSPVVLSCCDATICSEHIEYKQVKVNETKTIQVFECELCQCSHNMKNKRFVINKLAERLLKIELDKISLGDAYVKVNKEIEKLESSLRKLNGLIQDPKNYIYEYISCVKRDVDLRREKLKAEIDKICGEMITKLENYQNECYENIESLKLKEKNDEIITEIQAKLDEWTQTNKRVLMVSTDQQRNEIELKAKHFDINLTEKTKQLQSDILMNKHWFHETNKKVAEEFERELVQFDGYMFKF
jgi:uncharacterized protein YlxP (DUF503 family)